MFGVPKCGCRQHNPTLISSDYFPKRGCTTPISRVLSSKQGCTTLGPKLGLSVNMACLGCSRWLNTGVSVGIGWGAKEAELTGFAGGNGLRRWYFLDNGFWILCYMWMVMPGTSAVYCQMVNGIKIKPHHPLEPPPRQSDTKTQRSAANFCTQVTAMPAINTYYGEPYHKMPL